MYKSKKESFTGVIFYSFLTIILVLLFFLLMFNFFYLIYDNNITMLPEYHDILSSYSPKAQQDAFLISLFVLFGSWIVVFFFYPISNLGAFGDWLVNCSTTSKIIWGNWVSRHPELAKRFEHFLLAINSRRSLRIINFTVIILIIVSLWVVIISYLYADVFTSKQIGPFLSADPHIFAIFGREGEIIAGGMQSRSDVPNYYGPGGAFAYAALRFIGFPANYHTALSLTWYSNLFFVSALSFSIFQFWRHTPPSFWKGLIALAVISAVIRPMLTADGGNVLYANHSGIRYFPVAVFLIFASCTSWSQNWLSIVTRVFFAGSGVILAPDAGLLALIGFAVFDASKANSVRETLLRGTNFIAATLCAVFLVWITSKHFFEYPMFDLFNQLSYAGSGFGGKIITWHLSMFVIVAVAIFTATYLIAALPEYGLPWRSGLTLATSIMIIAWVPYYLHRPAHYHIFWSLALFPLSYFIQLSFKSAVSIRAMVLTPLLCVITLCMFSDVRVWPKKKTLIIPSTQGLMHWSGLYLPQQLAQDISSRIYSLKQFSNENVVVVTGLPMAVTMTGDLHNVPVEPIFSLGHLPGLTTFITRMHSERPQVIVLDATDAPLWAASTISGIGARIEEEISSTYQRDETIKLWRVWRLK